MVGNQFGPMSEDVNGLLAHFKKDKCTVQLWMCHNKKSLRDAIAAGIRSALELPPDFHLSWYKTTSFIEGGIRKFFKI